MLALFLVRAKGGLLALAQSACQPAWPRHMGRSSEDFKSAQVLHYNEYSR